MSFSVTVCFLAEVIVYTPDGVIVMADGTVLALDVVVVGTGDKAQETARRKRFGWGSLGALERAKRAQREQSHEEGHEERAKTLEEVKI